MGKNENLRRLSQNYFNNLFNLKASIAGTEADSPAGRLARQIDELKPFDFIFSDLSSDQPDVRPLIDVLRRVLDDLPGGRASVGSPGVNEWQMVFSYLKDLHNGLKKLHNAGASTVSESLDPAGADAETEVAVMPKPVDAEAFPEPDETTKDAASVESPSFAINGARGSVDGQTPVEQLATETSSNPSSKGPTGADGPVVRFFIKTSAESENVHKVFDLIRMLMDKAPPIMGKTGNLFFYSLNLNLDKSFSVVEAEGSQELAETFGLAVTLEDGQIVLRGNPSVGFDGPLHFDFARVDHSQEAHNHKKPMYIAADPRTLWQNLPVEDFEGYPVENDAWEARQLAETGKIVVAASCRGRAHAHAAKPRDDSFLIEADEGSGWNFVAVADGAGSSRFSRKGSRLACETILGALKQILPSPKLTAFFQANNDCLNEWSREFKAADGRLEPAAEEKYHRQMNSDLSLEVIVYEAVSAGYKSIKDEAQTRGAQACDYHTTLICAAFKKFDFGWFIISYWVGDGAIALYGWNQGDRVLVPGIPDGGEFAGQTRFLTMGWEEINPEAVARRTKYIFADDFEALILATDGITDAFFPSEKSVLDEAEWRNFWRRILPTGDTDTPPCPELFDGQSPPDDQARVLRRWLDFWSKGNHDDRTILIVK